MKTRFSKLLSVLLCLSMLLSAIGVTVIAAGDAPTEYYIKKGGNGDGTSAGSPAGSINAIISKINADGHTAGDLVTVYVIDSGEGAKCKNKELINSDIILGYNTPAHHEATIKYTSYSDSVTSVIGHVDFRGMNNHAAHLIIQGNSIFENINILDVRNSTAGSTDIYCNFYDVTFKDVIFMDLTNTTSYVYYPSSTHFSSGSIRNTTTMNRDSTVVLSNASVIGDYADMLGYTDNSKNQTLNGSATTKFESGTVKNLFLSNANALNTVNKNVNLVLGKNVKVTTVNNTKTIPVIKGALQVVKNYGASLPTNATFYGYADSSKTAKTPYYDITVKSNDIYLDVTADAGKYTVAGGKTAYSLSADGKTLYVSQNGLFQVDAADTYNVDAAESVDAAKDAAGIPTTDEVGMEFMGWVQEAPGKFVANFAKRDQKSGTYYVQFGASASNDGLTPETPLPYVANVVDAINASGEFVAGDIVNVKIMNDTMENFTYYDKDGNDIRGSQYHKNNVGRFTCWSAGGGKIADYKPTLVISSYNYENTGVKTYLAWSEIIGKNTNLVVSGPTIFKNITLVNPRTCDREYFINGYDVTFENADFGYMMADYYQSSAYDGKIYPGHGAVMLSNSGNATVAGGKLTINSSYTGSGRYGIFVPGRKTTFTEPVTIQLGENVDVPLLYGGVWDDAAMDSTFESGLTFVLDGAKVTPSLVKNGTSKLTINGGFQLIADAENDVFTKGIFLDNGLVTVNGGTWNIKINSNQRFLSPTETPGTYAVTGDMIAVAGNEETGDSVVSKDGVLVLEAGNWTVTSVDADEAAELITNVTFDGKAIEGNTYLKGFNIKLPTLEDELLREFRGWSYNGVEYAGGESFMIPDEDNINFVSLWKNYSDTVLIWLDGANGNDAKDGLSATAAVKTLTKALELAEKRTEATKKIVVVGTYGVEGTYSSDTAVIITGDGTGNSVLDLNKDYFFINFPVTIENIELAATTTGSGKFMNIMGKPAVIGENVTGKTSLRLGSDSSTFKFPQDPIDVVINNGSFGNVNVGAYYNNSKRGTTKDVDIVINGGELTSLNFQADGYQNIHHATDFIGDVKVTVNGGTVGGITIGTSRAGDAPAFKKTVQILVNNGLATSLPNITADGGVWKIKAKAAEGCYLEMTNTIGTYKVYGTKTAVAKPDTGNIQYVSVNGQLVLPAGNYEVEFVDKIYYINDGSKITVYNDCEIDLAKESYAEPEGKYFIGWTREDGTTIPAKVSCKANDVLVANYIDYTEYDEETGAGDFYIKGAQIRTKGTQGLRFIVDKKDAFYNALPNAGEFGTLVLPTERTWGRSMFLDTPIVAEWTWDSATKTQFTMKTSNGNTPRTVKGEKIFKRNTDGVEYTVCITGIAKKFYDKHFTVRGYIKYTDLNGIAKVFYSDYYQTSLYKLAVEAVENNDTSSTRFEFIKNYFETTHKANYLAENYDTRKNLSGYADTADKNPNHAMYQLANGLKVREVTIETGKGDRDPVEIVQFADTHLNFINERDIEEGEVNTLSTYRGRSWLRNGSSVVNIARAMEYASFFDKTVITGDIMDYFSWGCGEIMTKMIIDRDPGAMLVIGNHEPAERMQPDLSGLSDKYTLAERYERLQSLWPKGQDLYYHSEIVKNDDGTDMVMLIALDNQRDKYWGTKQSVPFAADIAKARELDIPILIFQHDPICTNNPADARATFFYEPGDIGGTPASEWYTDMSKRFAGSDTNDKDTMMVYDMIAMNYDIIKGVFCGHWHNHMYTEILGKNADGTFAVDENGNNYVIPQHVVTANAYGNGNAIKITVK